MTDIKEAQGLEVSVYTDQHGTAIRADILRHTQIEADGLEPHCRLSDATAVIDQQGRRIELLDEANRQLREQVEYTEGMYATALEIVDELRADLETANSMLVATSKAGIQLRERVAELEQAITSSLPCSYYMDLPDGGDPSLEEQLRRMAEDAANLRIAELRLHEVATHCTTVEQELAALKSAPVAMPAEAELIAFAVEEQFLLFCDGDEFVQIAAAVLHKFARLNRSKT